MVYAIPFFILLIAAEVLYGRAKGLRVYGFHETVSHFTTGAGQQVFNLLWFAGLAVIYSAVQSRFAIFEVDVKSVAAWAALLLATDFCWYVSHRASHRVNLMVATHAVHHQASDFNHGSALRQSWTSRPALFVFYVPFAILGVPPAMLIGSQVVSGAIQFLSHNGVIRRKLGFLEYVLVTPRTHRVHHGLNAPYLDKNFGGMFIVWDRLFGTFVDQDEKNEVQLGTLDDLNHFDPIECNLNYLRRLWFVSRSRPGILPKISIWFQSPERLAEELVAYGYVERAPRQPVRELGPRGKSAVYGLVVATTASVVLLMKNAAVLDVAGKLGLGALVLLGVWAIGQLLVGRWAWASSGLRAEGAP